MAFNHRRGRPKSDVPRNDPGTPELIMKRLHHLTEETIDICLHRGLITRSEHWCAVHLRWLYTLKFGAPGVRAVDPTHLGGIEIKVDNEKWRAEREREYEEAIGVLKAAGSVDAVLDVCVYNQPPRSLSSGATAMKQRLPAWERDVARLATGLNRLCALWDVRQ